MSGREELERQVLAALGEPCEECALVIRRMLNALNDTEVGTLDDLAHGCGFRARWALARHLGKHGLPGPRPLKDWLCFLTLRYTWETEHISLQRQAMRMGVEPSVLHRLARRLTGGTWDAAKQLDFSHWLGRFRTELGAPARCARKESIEHE